MFVIERPDDHEKAKRKAESNISSVEVATELDVDGEIILDSTEDEIAASTE